MPKHHEDWSHDDARPDSVLNLKTVHKMLPLVRGIVADVLNRLLERTGYLRHCQLRARREGPRVIRDGRVIRMAMTA